MKKGISLIVLVITIIVIIILAGAVILSLASNNPIAQASEAVYKQDKVEVQSAINMLLAKEMAAGRDVATVQAGTLLTDGSGTATYTIGSAGTPQTFQFGTGTGKVGIALPSYTASWAITVDGIVTLTVGSTTY
jgi:hypothetical protein